MDSTVATVHPIGHAHQIPVAPRIVLDRTYARTTRKTRSVKVAIIKFFIVPAPLNIPSATNYADITK